jgi:hypothetical protein
MVTLTLRLGGRRIHLVRDPQDCDGCTDRASHVRMDPRRALQREIDHAASDDAGAMAGSRSLVLRYGELHGLPGLTDARALEQVQWLLETDRLVAFECTPAWEHRPVLPPEPMAGERPRPRPTPIQDVKSWVAIELVDDAGKPVADQAYRIKVPGGAVEEGRLDAKGRAKVANIDPGMCDISFPDIDAKEWKKA